MRNNEWNSQSQSVSQDEALHTDDGQYSTTTGLTGAKTATTFIEKEAKKHISEELIKQIKMKQQVVEARK